MMIEDADAKRIGASVLTYMRAHRATGRASCAIYLGHEEEIALGRLTGDLSVYGIAYDATARRLTLFGLPVYVVNEQHHIYVAAEG
jgi:hypothetical protein